MSDVEFDETDFPTRTEIEQVMNQAVAGLDNATPVARNEARYQDVETWLKNDSSPLKPKDIRAILSDLPSYGGWETE